MENLFVVTKILNGIILLKKKKKVTKPPLTWGESKALVMNILANYKPCT